MNTLRDQFLLDPAITFLNHGSFGATPRPVFEVYQDWQRRLEYDPIHFIDKELAGHLKTARQSLAEYLGVDGDDLAYVPNATFGVNVVARSLALGPGDEVLATDQEYGACNNVWQYLTQKQGFQYLIQPLPWPFADHEETVEQLWQGVTPRTRVIYLSHITSATALRLPVEEICRRAREAGILTVVDGAHAPGQMPLDLTEVGADFYTGNCHKWLCSPKGAGFLYARPERQSLIEPLVIGWGWGPDRSLTFGSDFLDYLQWLGTDDLSAYLAVPATIQFQAENDWPTVRRWCHDLLTEILQRIGRLTGLPSPYPAEHGYYHQMAIAPLPRIADLPAFKQRLYDCCRIQIPCTNLGDRQFIRISIQGYNTPADVDRLLAALADLLPLE
jgi:isopenicillin-N epimerase